MQSRTFLVSLLTLFGQDTFFQVHNEKSVKRTKHTKVEHPWTEVNR